MGRGVLHYPQYQCRQTHTALPPQGNEHDSPIWVDRCGFPWGGFFQPWCAGIFRSMRIFFHSCLLCIFFRLRRAIYCSCVAYPPPGEKSDQTPLGNLEIFFPRRGDKLHNYGKNSNFSSCWQFDTHIFSACGEQLKNSYFCRRPMRIFLFMIIFLIFHFSSYAYFLGEG